MNNSLVPAGAKKNELRRREIKGMIADGQSTIILDTKVLKLDAWIKFHLEGELAIKYMISSITGRWTNFVPPTQGGRFRRYNCEEDGEEAGGLESEISSGLRRRKSTSTISSALRSTSLPSSSSELLHSCVLDARTQKEIMLDQVNYPPVDAKHQGNITQKYRALNKRIQKEGLYNCNYFSYAVETFWYSILFALFIFCLRHSCFGFAGLFLGCFWHQLVFTAHDAGHMGIMHDFQTVSVLSSQTSLEG
ncbi:uncharacterized protein ASPGLDRAFT_1489871 [Aspergillus glaucus CBS 516.65]|uniref:Uncharacterized protein n=1 Tax=Aspergillus glaucus CBS 516.65 TaxID=1160497 RepID=A0A1L9VZH6_ASPGL|nr:hypothetical protein ASPGLDRAFT_1489871 [Aspergillus glaucus CBS 516.65]OJJ89312.1 hypothetical protein ASPGLDRAFT_1489871 [Aspergillus glaucus CBS 516.65]